MRSVGSRGSGPGAIGFGVCGSGFGTEFGYRVLWLVVHGSGEGVDSRI